MSFVCHLDDTRTFDRLEVVLQQLARLRILVLNSQLDCLRDNEDGSRRLVSQLPGVEQQAGILVFVLNDSDEIVDDEAFEDVQEVKE